MLSLTFRYLGIIDSLFDDIVLDLNREDFKVGDKYKTKHEELGKLSHICLFSRFLLSI